MFVRDGFSLVARAQQTGLVSSNFTKTGIIYFKMCIVHTHTHTSGVFNGGNARDTNGFHFLDETRKSSGFSQMVIYLFSFCSFLLKGCEVTVYFREVISRYFLNAARKTIYTNFDS